MGPAISFQAITCWLLSATFYAKKDQKFRGKFKDYSFFIPTESAGSAMIAKGTTYKSLRKEESKGTPTYEFRLEAIGVLLKN